MTSLIRFPLILSGLFVTACASIALLMPGTSQALFYPTGGGTYTLQSSISSTQSTLTLTSFREPGSLIPYTTSYINTNTIYGTISPSSGNSEFIAATGVTQNANGTATLTGVTRGLARTPGTGGCVASSTLAHAYPGQTQFILSDSPCFLSQYFVKQNNETVSGNVTFTGATTFSTFPITPTNSTSSESAAGLVQLATRAQVAGGIATSTNGTNAPLVISSGSATSTYATTTANNRVIVTRADGTIDPKFLGTTTVALYAGTAASSTVLSSDGHGNALFSAPQASVLGVFGTTLSTSATASTTLARVTLPAGTMSSTTVLHFKVFGSIIDNTGNQDVDVVIGSGSATTTLKFLRQFTFTNSNFSIDGEIFSTSASAQTSFMSTATTTSADTNSWSNPIRTSVSSSITASAVSYIEFRANPISGSNTVSFNGIYVEKLSQ